MKIMHELRIQEILRIATNRIQLATNHIEQGNNQNELKKAINEESEIPGFESKPMKFGQFVNKEFVVMMTDIRSSTDIINAENGLIGRSTERFIKVLTESSNCIVPYLI